MHYCPSSKRENYGLIRGKILDSQDEDVDIGLFATYGDRKSL